MIDRESQRVLFAEAGKEFIDFLFHILSLPVGTFIPLFEKQGMQGSFGNIFESIENLGSIYLQPSVNKEILLKPKVHISGGGGSGLPLLLQSVESSPSSSSSRSTKFYRCNNVSSSCDPYVAYDIRAICPSCSQVMNLEQNMVDPPSRSATKTSSSYTEGGYVKGLVTYMVMDDLEVKLMSTISSITLLINKFNVKGIRALEEKVVNFGMDEGVKLLKASLYSKSVLTDIFLPMVKQEVNYEN
ncbi:hypothetical protein ACJW30_06G169000 [Castanea mollissima]